MPRPVAGVKLFHSHIYLSVKFEEIAPGCI